MNNAFLSRNYVVIAETEEKGLIGFLHFYTLGGKEGHIWEMSVLKEYRDRGLEDALVEQSLEMMRSLNYISATAYLIPYTDEEKLGFWKSKGFQEVSFSFALCNRDDLLDKVTKLYAFMKEKKALSEPEVWFWLMRPLKKIGPEEVSGISLRSFTEDDIDEVELDFKTKLPDRLFPGFEYERLESNKLARETWLKFSFVAVKNEEIIGYCIAMQDQKSSVSVVSPIVITNYQKIALEVKQALVNRVVEAARNTNVGSLGCQIIKYPLTEDLPTSQLKEWAEFGFQPVRILFSVEVREPKGFYNTFRRTIRQTNDLGLELCPDYQIDFALEKGFEQAEK